MRIPEPGTYNPDASRQKPSRPPKITKLLRMTLLHVALACGTFTPRDFFQLDSCMMVVTKIV